MADLSNTSFSLKQACALLGVAKFRGVFFNANGTAKTQAEVESIVCGTFAPAFCSGIQQFYNSRSARCLLGYTHIKLSVFPTFIALPWSGLGDNTFTVTANKPWFIQGYISSFFNINKTSGGAGNTIITVTPKSANTGALPRHASFTVVCGSREISVQISQDFEDGLIIHK